MTMMFMTMREAPSPDVNLQVHHGHQSNHYQHHDDHYQHNDHHYQHHDKDMIVIQNLDDHQANLLDSGSFLNHQPDR